MADYRHFLPLRNFKVHVFENRSFGLVVEANVFEAHGAMADIQHFGIGLIGDFRIFLQQTEHAVHVGERVLDLAVDHPRKFSGMNTCSMKALTSTRSPRLMVPRSPLGSEDHYQGDAMAMIEPGRC